MGVRNRIRKKLISFSSNITASKDSKALFYHDIHSKDSYTPMSTHIELFKDHIACIRDSGFEIVSSITKEKGQIEISFDDAYKGIYDNFSLIEALSVPVQLFVISSFLDRKNYISVSMLKEISNHPLIHIGSHTHRHSKLSSLTQKELEIELKESKQSLEQLTQNTITSICYPEGKFSPSVVSMANSCGYDNQYSSIPGPFFSPLFNGKVKRRSLVQFADLGELTAILKGGDNILSSWYFNKHFIR